MTEFVNPYQTPRASLDPTSPEGCWRQGGVLVMRQDNPLPPRCVKCNTPTEQPAKQRRVYWHHPALYLLIIFPGLLIYAIVALIVRKSAWVAPGLCAEHKKRRILAITGGWLGFLAGIAIMIAGGANDSCGTMVAGLVLFLGAIITGLIMARILYPERIDSDFVRLKGCGSAFLDSLPEFHG